MVRVATFSGFGCPVVDLAGKQTPNFNSNRQTKSFKSVLSTLSHTSVAAPLMQRADCQSSVLVAGQSVDESPVGSPGSIASIHFNPL